MITKRDFILHGSCFFLRKKNNHYQKRLLLCFRMKEGILHANYSTNDNYAKNNNGGINM